MMMNILSGALSAERRRRRELEACLHDMERERSRKLHQAQLHADYVDELVRGHMSADERYAIRDLVVKAIANGRSASLIYSFPAENCLDGGRAIAENLPNWQETLEGQVSDICRSVASNGRPRGYRVRPAIIDLVDGLPANIGLFLCWDASIGPFEA